MNKNKVVLITGATRGIGKATAIMFAKEGYNVIINYKDSDDLVCDLKHELEQYKTQILTIKADICDETSIKNMVDYSITHFGHIDVLVNNAGICIDTTFEDKTKSNFIKILETNLVGTFLVSKYVGKYMLEKQQGKIINVASTNGIDTYYPESLDYDVSKAGIISLTHNLAYQYKPYINVNCVAPGWTNTDMNCNLDKEFISKENKKIFLNRFAEPEEIAKVIFFLANEDANYINNEVIRVDGGYKNE